MLFELPNLKYFVVATGKKLKHQLYIRIIQRVLKSTGTWAPSPEALTSDTFSCFEDKEVFETGTIYYLLFMEEASDVEIK